MENPHKPDGSHKLVHFWPVIAAIGVTLLGYGALQQRVSANETKIEKAEQRQDTQGVQTQQTAVAVAEMKGQVTAMQKQVDEANKKLDKLLERR